MNATGEGARGTVSLSTEFSATGSPNLAVFLVFVTLGFLLLAHGGFFPRTYFATGLLLVSSVAVAMGAGKSARALIWSPFVLAAVGVGSWALVRAAMAGDVSLGWGTAAISFAVAGVFGVVSTSTAAARTWFVRGLLVAGAIVALSGWIGLAFRIDPLAIASAGVWRATTTITYANGAAAVLVCLALVALGLRAVESSQWTGAVAMLLLVGAGATQSRAGAAAILVGSIVLGVGMGWRRLAAAAMAPVAGALVALAALLPSIPTSSSARPLIAGGGLAAGLALTTFLTRRRSSTANRRSAALVAAITVIAAVGAVLLVGIDLGDRISLTTGDRPTRNQAALDLYADDPLIGTGPGRLWLTWEDAAGRSVVGLHIHNEYLQTLVQLGAIGALLVGGLLITGARTVHRGRNSSLAPAVWWGIVAGLTGLLLHSGFDFLWHIPVIPLLGAALVAAAAPTRKEVRNG